MRFFSYFRNVIAFIGAIWILIQIYNYFSQSKVKLIAHVDSHEYSLMPSIAAVIDSPDLNLSFFNFLPGQLEANRLGKSESPVLIQMVDSLTELINRSNDRRSHLERFGYTSAIDLENVGEKEIKGITLLAVNNFRCYYTFKRGGKVYEGYTIDKVEIGDLMPSEKLRITIWYHSDLGSDYFRIIFPEGQAKMKYYKKLSGIPA